MLRTNIHFLNFINSLYENQVRKEHIILKTFQKGDLLLEQGEPAHKIYLIKEGICKCFVKEENDRQFILEFLSKGEILGELEFLQQINCLCNVQALEKTTAFCISIPYFSTLLKEDHLLSEFLLYVYSQRIINTASRASFQQLYTIEHSLLRILELQKNQNIKFSKEDLADYLGISIRSLNRELKKLNLKLS